MASKLRLPVILNAIMFVAVFSYLSAVAFAAPQSTYTLASRSKPRSSLKNGQILKSRQTMVDGTLLLIMQEDCNLVLYQKNLTTGAITVIWDSQTQSNNTDLCFLLLQHDGNLVIYLTEPGNPEEAKPYWQSNTTGVGHRPYTLKFVPVDERTKFPGGVAIYDRDWTMIWSNFESEKLES